MKQEPKHPNTIKFDHSKPEYFDTKIIINKKDYYASKFCLSQESDVFSGMLVVEGWKESQKNKDGMREITLQDTDPDVFEKFLAVSHHEIDNFFEDAESFGNILFRCQIFADKFNCKRLTQLIDAEFHKLLYYLKNDEKDMPNPEVIKHERDDALLDYIDDFKIWWMAPDKLPSYKGKPYCDCVIECLEYLDSIGKKTSDTYYNQLFCVGLWALFISGNFDSDKHFSKWVLENHYKELFEQIENVHYDEQYKFMEVANNITEFRRFSGYESDECTDIFLDHIGDFIFEVLKMEIKKDIAQSHEFAQGFIKLFNDYIMDLNNVDITDMICLKNYSPEVQKAVLAKKK